MARLECRIPKEAIEIIQQACNLMGVSLAGFIIDSALSRACKILLDIKNIKESNVQNGRQSK